MSILSHSATFLSDWLSFSKRELPIGDYAHLSLMEEALEKIYARDTSSYSFIFEPSVQWSDSNCHLYRFSYSWPHFQSREQDVLCDIRNLVKPFGTFCENWFESVLKLTQFSVVEQLLFGMEIIDEDTFRLKLYFQLKSGLQNQKNKILNSLLSINKQMDLHAELEPLHLIGIDLGKNGISEVKLYRRVPTVNIEEEIEKVGGNPLLCFLLSAGVTQLADYITIERIKAPGRAASGEVSEIDFSLRKNSIDWSTLKSFILAEQLPFNTTFYERFKSVRRLLENRVSVSLTNSDKMNLYYLCPERT